MVAAFLGGTAGHVARHQVTEGRIAALQIVVALIFGYVAALYLAALQLAGILNVFRHPDAAVVTQ